MLQVLCRHTVASVVAVSSCVVSLIAANPAHAQDRGGRAEREVRIVRTPDGVSITRTGSPDRAVLGVILGEGSRADTAGVRVESVEPGGPAAKAGLKAGDIITDVNGTSLRVAREDAEDPALEGLAQRRLQRVIAQVKPGDEVSLRLRSGGSGGSARAATVKTVSAAELDRAPRAVERAGAPGRERSMVGVNVRSAGNARDTLGLFVSSVVTGGPAEMAGIIEGERIAAVNGADVRVPREDLGDARVAAARIDRFVREVQRTEPGKALSLRVYGNGRYRDVAVTAAKASNMPGGSIEGEPVGWQEMLRNFELRMNAIPGVPLLRVLERSRRAIAI